MRSRSIEIREYPRGDILDHNRLPLTGTCSSPSAYLLHAAWNSLKAGAYQERLEALAKILDMPPRELQEKINEARKEGHSFVRIRSDLSPEQQKKIQSCVIPGLVYAPALHRYREDGFCVHLIGYLDKSASGNGLSGIEKTYNSLLSSADTRGEMLSVLDGRNQIIQGLMFRVKQQEDLSGSVVLTIDRRVQEAVENAMDRLVRKGAVVVMDVDSKEILALASRPKFNPYQVAETLSAPEQALLNRAFSPYHPGSIFKIAVSIAALEEGTAVPGEKHICEGKYSFNEKLSISCLKKEGHGQLSMEQAFALSCNPSFIQIGLSLGRSALLDWVERLQLLNNTIIGLPGQIGDSYVNIDGGPAALANACLGQKGVMLTPVQVASLLSTVADDGQWAAPRILAYTVDRNGKLSRPEQKPKLRVMNEETAQNVGQMLQLAVTEGTGRSAAIPETEVAGKTASSQTGRYRPDETEVLNTWFAGYLPAEHPRWAIVVLVEGGQSGAQSSAPVFQEIARQLVGYSGQGSR